MSFPVEDEARAHRAGKVATPDRSSAFRAASEPVTTPPTLVRPSRGPGTRSALQTATPSAAITGRRRFLGRLVAVWLVVEVVVTAAAGYAVQTARANLTDSFELRAEVVADGLAAYVEERQVLAAARAVDLLADETVSVDQLQTVATGLGFTIGAVFDADGRLLVGLPYRADFVGRDFTGDLEHIRIAVAEGRPVVSQAVVSPAIDTPVVAIAAPYATPYGTRIITGVFALQGGPLSAILSDAVALDAWHVELIDRDGIVIAANADQMPAELTPLAMLRPGVAEALNARTQGEFMDSDGQESLFTSADVAATGWRLIARSTGRLVPWSSCSGSWAWRSP